MDLRKFPLDSQVFSSFFAKSLISEFSHISLVVVPTEDRKLWPPWPWHHLQVYKTMVLTNYSSCKKITRPQRIMTRILYLKVRWSEKPLSMETFNLAQYIMVNWTLGSRTEVTKKTGNHSIIFLKFKFDRTLGFYILQIYIPLTIIVMSSWVAFWSP